MRETTARLYGVARTPYPRRLLTRRLPVLAGAVAVLAILGPFGTFLDLSFVARLAYWGGLIAVGTLLFDLVVLIAQRVLPDHERTWPLMLGAALLTVSLIQTLCVATLESALRGLNFVTPLGLAELYVYVLVVTLLVSGLPIWLELRDRGLIGGRPVVPPSPANPIPTPAAAAFLDRIPTRLGRDLLALEMEDHYVRVHTMAGSDLILMRLRDAIAELTGIDGLQVHRSHWVAAAAVAEVERKADGKLVLRLTNGLRVPVSRSYAATVRAAGWTERTVA